MTAECAIVSSPVFTEIQNLAKKFGETVVEEAGVIRFGAPDSDMYAEIKRGETGELLVETENTAFKSKVAKWDAKYPVEEQSDEPTAEETPAKVDEVQEPSIPPKVAKTAPKTEVKTSTKDMLTEIAERFGRDVIEIFGKSGHGKSKLAAAIALNAIQNGHKVIYLDTERNLSSNVVEAMGSSYKYTPKLSEIEKFVAELPPADLFIMDSIGFPVLTSFAKMKMNQRGDALIKIIAIFGDVKIWCYEHNAVAIIVNQPESEFGKTDTQLKQLRPFGDKSAYAAKNIFWVEKKMIGQGKTESDVVSFRSRDYPDGAKLGVVTITNDGVDLKWL